MSSTFYDLKTFWIYQMCLYAREMDGSLLATMGPRGCFLGSYADGQNSMGQHEGIETQSTRCIGPFEGLRMEAYWLLQANSGSSARGRFPIHMTIFYVLIWFMGS